jgi:hypothetical protein
MSRQSVRNLDEMGTSYALAGSSSSCSMQHDVTLITPHLQGVTRSAVFYTRQGRDMAHDKHPLPRAQLVAAAPDLRAGEGTALPDRPAGVEGQVGVPFVALLQRWGQQAFGPARWPARNSAPTFHEALGSLHMGREPQNRSAAAGRTDGR